MQMRYRTAWVSDVHLGTRDCRIDLFLEFLDAIDVETLYLVGDIIDIESLKRSFFWPPSHTQAVERILEIARRGTRVVYVPGNHDEDFRSLDGIDFGPVEVTREALHETADGKRLLVLHGDRFDSVLRAGVLAQLAGHFGYRLLVGLNRLCHSVNSLLGRPYWSLANAVKSRIGGANRYIEQFRRACLDTAREKQVDGIVCGHIHKAELLDQSALLYCNDGDWVESCSALLESSEGALELCFWADVRDSVQASGPMAVPGLREAA